MGKTDTNLKYTLITHKLTFIGSLSPAHFHFSFLPCFKWSLQGTATFGTFWVHFWDLCPNQNRCSYENKILNFKMLFQCNVEWGNVYRKRIGVSLPVLNKCFSLTMQLTKNSNAHQNKLTNNHVSLRPRQLIEAGFLRNEEKVFLPAFMQKQWMESFKWTCEVY